MNLLASRTDAILLSEEALASTQLKIGDPLQGQVTMGGSGGYQPRFTIVGTYKYFPTVFPDQPVAITNLDYLFSLTGGPTEHQIWLKLKEGVPVTNTLKAMSDMGVEPAGLQDAGALIGEEKAKTERVGVFGTLSVGFLGMGMERVIVTVDRHGNTSAASVPALLFCGEINGVRFN